MRRSGTLNPQILQEGDRTSLRPQVFDGKEILGLAFASKWPLRCSQVSIPARCIGI